MMCIRAHIKKLQIQKVDSTCLCVCAVYSTQRAHFSISQRHTQKTFSYQTSARDASFIRCSDISFA